MRRAMTDKGVRKFKRRAKAYSKPDSELRGHWVRVYPSGTKSFWTIGRAPDGKQRWDYVGPADAMSIEAAREKAREMLTRVRAGLPAIPPKADTFGAVISDWLKRHVDGKKLRSRDKLIGLLDRHVGAELRAREFTAIRRDDITALLDEVEDDHSARQADSLLSVISSVMSWYAARHSDYNSPIVRGMKRTDPKKKKRDRKLDDDEIRAVWAAAETSGTFGALVQMLLLTMQRLDRVTCMQHSEVDADGVWTLPPLEPGEKENIGKVLLPEAARDILAKLPRFAGNDFVFAGQGSNKPIAKSGKYMAAFRRKLPKTMQRWTLHDLRRTSRSLMSQAGVSADHAERAMGHVIGGVRGIYDRHAFFHEKTSALEKLAALIDRIVNPPADVVVPMRKEIR